jgi:PAS domain S-box-containing protein
MFTHSLSEQEKRVLLLAPTVRDAEVTTSILSRVKIPCEHCKSIECLTEELQKGAAAVVFSDSFHSLCGIDHLIEFFETQPSWSDLPVVLMVEPGGEPPPFARFLPNVTFLERPAPVRTVLSAVQTAVRARGRQYQIRTQLREIREARNEFEAMANSIAQLAWMADRDRGAFWFNRRWYEYTGSSPAAMKRTGWQKLIEPDLRELAQAEWSKAINEGGPFEMQLPLRSAAGEYRMFLTTAQPFQREEGQFMRWFGTCTDIEELSRLRTARESMLESERAARIEAERAARLKDEFLATLSHELRTPLTAILGWTELIKIDPGNEETAAKGAAVIERSARIQAELIEDLLDMSRILSGKMRLEFESVILSNVVTAALDSVHTTAETKGIDILTRFDPDERPVYGDPARLQQIVWNLLSNALKFTPPGGRIHVSIDKLDGEVQLAVQDSGKGIQPSFLPHIFERFRQEDASSTRHHGGLGIGLALVKQFVELHGGSIAVASEGEGKGARFTVTLPLEDLASRPRSSHGSVHRGRLLDLEGITVLVVDDEPDAREFFERILIECHADVATASNVDEAIQLVHKRQPDAILSDIGMPGRDGYQFIEELRREGNQIPAAAITAFVRPEDRAKSISAGFQYHLSKPVEPTELLATVASLVGKR